MKQSLRMAIVTTALIKIINSERDNCTACNGSRGGVKGNENVIDGKLVCDYCHADIVRNQQTEGE